jgi:hypothetical protein
VELKREHSIAYNHLVVETYLERGGVSTRIEDVCGPFVTQHRLAGRQQWHVGPSRSAQGTRSNENMMRVSNYGKQEQL